MTTLSVILNGASAASGVKNLRLDARRSSRRFFASLRMTAGLLLLASALFAQENFRFERAIVPGGRGPNRLDPDLTLVAGSASQSLADLRIYDSDGREAPYLMVPPRSTEARWRGGRIFPIRATKNSSGFEADLGGSPVVDRVRLDGLGAPVLKRFRLEGSGDRARWTVLVADGTIFDLPEEKLRRTEGDFPAGEYRYLRITWDDRESARVPVPGAVSARLVERGETDALLEVPVQFERRSAEPRKSRFHLRLPANRLPVTALRIQVERGHVLREAQVFEGRLEGGQVKPRRLGHGTLRRTEHGGIVAEEMRIEVEPPEGPDLELEVDDGNNPPLTIKGVYARLAPQPWIYFESDDGSALRARYGNPSLGAPRYDVEAMRHYLAEVRPHRARWGSARETGRRDAPARQPLTLLGAELDPAGFRFSREIPSGDPGLTSLLADITVLAHARDDLGDVRIVDESKRQIPYLLERRPEPLRIDLPYPKRSERSTQRISVYELKLPFESLPNDSRLVLETDSRVFEREVTVVQPPRPGQRDDPRVLTRVSWRHADPDTEAPVLDISVPIKGVPSMELRIDEGDNAPLSLRPPTLLLPAYRLRFFYPEDAELTLLYGSAATPAPRYDLSLLAARLFGAPTQELSLRDEQASGGSGSRRRGVFWLLLGGVAAVLLVLLARLLRQPKKIEH